MKILLPILCAVAVFFAARFARPLFGDAPVTPAQTQGRPELRGLARQAERLSRNNGTVSGLEKLHRAGNLSAAELLEAVRRSASSDPQGTWEWIEESDFPGSVRISLHQAVMPVWFAMDSAAALSKIRGCDFFEATQLAGSLLGGLSSPDPAVSARVRDHLDTLVSLNGGDLFRLNLPPRTPEGGALLLSLPEGTSKDSLLSAFASSWLGGGLPGGKTWVKSLSPAMQSEVMETFARNLFSGQVSSSAEQLEFATAWLLKEASPSAKARLGPGLAESMAEKDPAAAMTWASANLSAGPLAEATEKIAAKMLANDPAKARQLVEDLPPGNLRHLAAYKVAEAWLATEPAAAVSWWLDRVDKEAAKGGGDLGNRWFETNPESFRAFLSDPSSPKIPTSVIFPAVQQMMARDKTSTFDWIATVPADRRPAVIKAAYQSWAYAAPAEAAAFFDSRPDLASGDAARQIATCWYGRDPGAVVGWISTLPWGGPREAALEGAKKMADFNVQLGGTFPEDLKKLLR